MLNPLLGRGNHDFGDAVGLLMGPDSDLAVGVEKLGGLGRVLVDILDELLDGPVDVLAV